MQQDRLDAFMALVTSANRSIIRIKTRGMLKYGLGSTHTVCLRKLYSAESGLTRTQLADECEMDKAQITRVVSELKSKGYVCESDDRTAYRRKIRLTEQGRLITQEVNGMVLDVNNFVSGEFSPEEIKAFYNVFGSICKNLKEAEIKIEESDDFGALRVSEKG